MPSQYGLRVSLIGMGAPASRRARRAPNRHRRRRKTLASMNPQEPTTAQGVQRIVLAALGAEPIRKAEEVLLVDRIQHRGSRPLDDFVFEGSNRDWALSAVRFWYVQSTARLCPIRSSVDPIVQVFDVAIEACLVVLPRQAVHPGCGVLLDFEERQPEPLDTDVVA